MPVLDATGQSDFLRRQVLTSRNVRGGRLTDVALGGLNYQIEDHPADGLKSVAVNSKIRTPSCS
jgi:hypothetical protein